MILFYILATAGITGTAVTLSYIAIKCANRVARLTAPPEKKHKDELRKMRETYKKLEELHKFIEERFTLDFNKANNYETRTITTIDFINTEILNAKKQIICANFKLNAYSQHADHTFCKELIKDFNSHVENANTTLKKLSEIWTDEYK